MERRFRQMERMVRYIYTYIEIQMYKYMYIYLNEYTYVYIYISTLTGICLLYSYYTLGLPVWCP